MNTSPHTFRLRLLAAVSLAMGVALSRELAKIRIKPVGGEPVSETARRVRLAISTGDYNTADDVSVDLLRQSHLGSWDFSPFAYFAARITDVADPVFEDHLTQWINVGRDKSVALLMRAQYYYTLGRFRRGSDFAWKIQAENVKVFDDNMEKALTDINDSIQVSSTNPYAFYLKLSIVREHGYSQKMKNAFEEAVKLFPDYYRLYEVMLSVSQPKWGGTLQIMYDFVDHYADPTNNELPTNLLYLSLYRYILVYAQNSCQSYERDSVALARCVKKGMADAIRPELEKNITVALNLYDHLDHMEFALAIESILSDLIHTPGGDTYSGAVLQMAASIMHTDTQLKVANPGQNNYTIDKDVGISWYVKGFYENALQKYRDAIRDVESTKFSNLKLKDLAVAEIYEQIARVYDKLHQYPEMIVYEESALKLGGANEVEHYICFGYYKLKAYDEAEKACTAAISHDARNLYARYWRSTVYRLMDKQDAAMQDLTIVADSESEFRSNAAIEMSMIYFGRNDLQGALDLLNRYTYLYDVRRSDIDSVAVAYNNRCYAYMELGDFKKALEDCTNSLKYGSLPDANRKEQELLKRLGSSGTSL